MLKIEIRAGKLPIFLIPLILLLQTGLLLASSGEDKETDRVSAAQALNGIRFDSYFKLPVYEQMREVCQGENKEELDCLYLVDQTMLLVRDEEQRKRMALFAAIRAFEQGDYSRASAYLQTLKDRYSLMDDYIHFFLGESAYQLKDWREAEKNFEALEDSSRLKLQAQFRAAFCKTRLRSPQSLEALQKLLNEHPNHFRAMETRFEIAELLRKKDPQKARELYISVMQERPGAGLGKTAEERLAGLKLPPLSLERRTRIVFEQAETLNRQFEYRKAAVMLGNAFDPYPKTKLKSAIVGEIQYRLGRTQFKRRNYSKALTRFKKALATQADPEVKGLALHMTVDARLRRGDIDKSIKDSLRFLADYPSHEKACAVRYMLGKAYKESDKFEKAIEIYTDLTRAHPSCNYAPSALWYIGWMHYKMEHWETARQALTRIAISDTQRFEKERAMYWLARIADRTGLPRHAVDIYRLLIRRYPLSYYSNLATQRLQDLGTPLPPSYLEKESLRGLEVGTDLLLDISKYKNQPNFYKGLELVRLGLGTHAEREFRELRKQFQEDENLNVMLAYLYYLTGDYQRSIYLFRTKIKGFSKQYPGSDNRSGWMLAYPLHFWQTIEHLSRSVALDPLLQIALIREESSFQAEVKSYAHAVGLTQIIYSTGRHIARQLGFKGFSLESLTDPETSIRFGSFHLKELIDKFKGNHALAISSYNAGETAVRRWVRERDDQPMDEFIEDIPYSQPRRYTRRVLKSYGIYRHLYSPAGRGFNLWRYPKEK